MPNGSGIFRVRLFADMPQQQTAEDKQDEIVHAIRTCYQAAIQQGQTPDQARTQIAFMFNWAKSSDEIVHLLAQN